MTEISSFMSNLVAIYLFVHSFDEQVREFGTVPLKNLRAKEEDASSKGIAFFAWAIGEQVMRQAVSAYSPFEKVKRDALLT